MSTKWWQKKPFCQTQHVNVNNDDYTVNIWQSYFANQIENNKPNDNIIIKIYLKISNLMRLKFSKRKENAKTGNTAGLLYTWSLAWGISFVYVKNNEMIYYLGHTYYFMIYTSLIWDRRLNRDIKSEQKLRCKYE